MPTSFLLSSSCAVEFLFDLSMTTAFGYVTLVLELCGNKGYSLQIGVSYMPGCMPGSNDEVGSYLQCSTVDPLWYN